MTCTVLERRTRYRSSRTSLSRGSKQENSRARQAGTRACRALHQMVDMSVARYASTMVCVRPGATMSKRQPVSPRVGAGASGNSPGRRDDAALDGAQPCVGEIGFVGLGSMGTVMAANPAASGRRVIAYVRRHEQIEKLKELGLRPTTDLGDLFYCKVVISMLPDDDAVREIVFGRRDIGVEGLAAGLMRGANHLSMSPISTAAASLLASEHARNGQGYVAAPVFGNPQAAKARQLFIVAAGVPSDLERCPPTLDVLGQRTFVIGANPADANLVKLLGNMMSATALEMLGEVVAVIRKRGLDPRPFIELMTSTMFGGRAHRIYGDKIASQDY